jgi:hypothetical protein
MPRAISAPRGQAVQKVLLPLLLPGVLAGGLLAFTLSIDDYVITFFVSGPGTTTLPLRVASMMKGRSLPMINALSTLMIASTFTVNLKPLRFLYALIGLTWCFHATYTVKTVIAEQGDLKRNGEFFSMMLIFLINAFLLIALFLAASPAPGLGLAEVLRCWWSVAAGIFGWLLGWVW